MRVATFNILSGRSPADDRVDVERFADAVRELDVDVLALQEVDRNQPRSQGADLTAVAAEAMKACEHRFVAALSGSPGATWMAATGDEQPDAAAYGIALLSRYPVSGWEVVRLPALPVRVPMRFKGSLRPVWVRDEPRVAVAATVLSPYGDMTVVNTHLSFISWWNGRQLHSLVRSVEGAASPLLLMGDLNMGPRRARALTSMRPLATHRTFPAHRPREQLDHILLRGDLPTPLSDVVPLPLSDHCALVVDWGAGR
jgi:endonuclease/exonuclease/phosphatase family metal-dependent hydrolase